MINPKSLALEVEQGATLLAVYRLRSDGDGDFIAAFDIQNCEERFGENSGEGAERLAQVVKDGLEFEGEEAVWICFNRPADIVDVQEGAQERWESQNGKSDQSVS